MQSYTLDFPGADDGPPSTDAYKRAVYKQPPRNFAVQVLPPQKLGNAHSYGMLITPFRDNMDRHSIMSRSSGSSGSSGESQATTAVLSALETATTAPLTTEYEIWRRWEDCLYFQDLLEVEYARMAREKRARLLAGKGVKKDGVYTHRDPVKRLHHAASFESLPPGPDPHMIAKDVHEILPRLTKKGKLFKTNKETIEQRGQEFKALIEALLREGDDVPHLIRELRQLRTVRDFFGFWRRDQDRMEKQFGKMPEVLRRRSESVGSRASSIFSSSGSGGMGIYFSPSTLSLQPPNSNVPDPLPTNKSPRRPAFMQGGKGAIILAPSSPNEAGPSAEATTPRRRAHTLQEATSTSSASDIKAELQTPPSSAPANLTFADAIEGGYSSDSASAASSRTTQSPRTLSPNTSPRSRLPQGSMEFRFSDIVLADDADAQKKSVFEDENVPIIVNLEGDESTFEDAVLVGGREFGRYERHLGKLSRLQDLTIKEEDEQDFDGAQSDSQPSGSSTGHDEFNSAGVDNDDRTIHDTERPDSRPWAHLSATVSSAQVAAARREALRSLTGGDLLNATSARNISSSEAPSARSSVLTVTSGSGSGSGSSSRSTNSGHLYSSDTQSSIDGRPYSYQSSIASCEDIDRTLSSSDPVILHSPLLEEYQDEKGQSDWRDSVATSRYHSRESVSSIYSSVTETSDSIIPPRPPRAAARAISPRRAVPSQTGLMGIHDPRGRENMVELRDSFFFGLPGPSAESQREVNGHNFDEKHEVGYSPPPTSNGHVNPSQTPPPIPPRSPRRPTSPISGNRSMAHSGPALPAMRSISPSPSVSTSIVSSMSEDLGVNAVSVKAIYGEHIVAFRIDRNSSLLDVREKLRHKLVNQTGVHLSDDFAIAYKPPAAVRVQELRRTAGRVRSSSVSNAGVTDPNSLRVLLSQRDWLETVGSCPPGAKMTLHVLHG